MMAAAAYGAVLGLVLSVLGMIGSPILWAAYWAVQTVLMSRLTVVVWQRTRLPLESAADAVGALASAIFVPASLAGYMLPHLPAAGLIAVICVGALVVMMRVLSWKLYREQHQRWRAFACGMSMRDMLSTRHIPILR
jgi:hypothetical protein